MVLYLVVGVILLFPGSFGEICGPPNFKITTLKSAPYWYTIVDESYCMNGPMVSNVGGKNATNITTPSNCAIIFSICKPLPVLCPGQEVCKIAGMDSSFNYFSWPIGLGSTVYSGFKFGEDKKSFKIEYHNGAAMTCNGKLQPIKTEISFKCEPKEMWNGTLKTKAPFQGGAKAKVASIIFDIKNCMYRISFNSSEGCPDYGPGGTPGTPLSTGSILLIIFFPSIFLYCIIGALVNVSRNKSGAELIPNYSFWKEFPSLVKDGCLFTLSCITCRQSGGSTSGPYQAM